MYPLLLVIDFLHDHRAALAIEEDKSTCLIASSLETRAKVQEASIAAAAHASLARDQQKSLAEKGRREQRRSIAHACSGCRSSLRPHTLVA
jgi:hypothetical protein